MNELQMEEGWITAITPKEIKALGKPAIGDEHFSYGSWVPVTNVDFENYWETGRPVRRPKSKSEPAMDDGWELVPKEEVKLNEKHPSWQFLGPSGNWLASEGVDPSSTYRRPKSKPEQYGWLKPSNETPMPTEGIFEAISDSGRRGNVTFDLGINRCVWQSSGMPVVGNVEYFYRQHPAPEVVKVDPMHEAWGKYWQSNENSDFATWIEAWQACCDHYKVGDQKGAK